MKQIMEENPNWTESFLQLDRNLYGSVWVGHTLPFLGAGALWGFFRDEAGFRFEPFFFFLSLEGLAEAGLLPSTSPLGGWGAASSSTISSSNPSRFKRRNSS